MTEEKRRAGLLGRDPTRTVVKLAIVSIVVGGVLALLDLSPLVFWRGIFDGLRNIIASIGQSFGEIVVNLATYLIFGALIVVPIWLISRLLSSRRDRS